MRQQSQRVRVKRKGMGLRARMTLSYVGTSILIILLLEFLTTTFFFLAIFPHLAAMPSAPGGHTASVPKATAPNIFGIVVGVLISTPFWLIIVAPAGAIFGAIFTGSLVKRIRYLIAATARFASGDYSQRVIITKSDEIGQLERQFNKMAEQLVESIKKQQELVEHNARMEERTRIEQELQTAHLIQHSLLPKVLPKLANWQIATYYQPAREVGGDLYDFLLLSDGRLGLVIGDVADKGVPAAIVMASTRSMLQAAAQASISPGEVLARVNNLLYADTPDRMFVTCFYAILNPKSGTLRYANAGHDLPYLRVGGRVEELQATGMPLGLMPGMQYEEKEVNIAPGESVLLYSDGLVEAHNEAHEMFGFPRLKSLLVAQDNHDSLVPFLLEELKSFTGDGWEQEDDVTLVTLRRMPEAFMTDEQPEREKLGKLSLTYSVASQPGNEREAMQRVAEAVSSLDLPAKRLENLKTAVAEAVMNAMEHGNHYQPDKIVSLQVYITERAITVRIRDEGEEEPLSEFTDLDIPDLSAKLAGLQTPRGWGLFLIKNLVDELHMSREGGHQIIELVMIRQNGPEQR